MTKGMTEPRKYTQTEVAVLMAVDTYPRDPAEARICAHSRYRVPADVFDRVVKRLVRDKVLLPFAHGEGHSTYGLAELEQDYWQAQEQRR